MPTIPRSERQIGIAGAPVSQTVNTAGFQQAAATVRQMAIDEKKAADKVLKSLKEKADFGWVVGKMGEAQSTLSKQRTKLENKYGADSIEFAEEFSRFSQQYGQELISKAPDVATRGKIGSQYLTLQNEAVKNVWKERDKAFKEKGIANLDSDLASLSTMAENNYMNWPEHYAAGIASLTAANDSFLTPSEFADNKLAFEKNIAKSSIRGLFRELPNKLQNVMMLNDGRFAKEYPDLAKLYNNLGGEERAALSNELLDEYNTQVTFQESANKRVEKLNKEGFGRNVIEFFLLEADDVEGQTAIFDISKRSKFMTPELLQKMQDRLNGVDEVYVDNPLALFQVRTEIQNKVITSAQEIAERIGLGLSATTARTEMLPLLRSVTNDRFQSARRFLMAELGLPEGMIVLDPNQPRREEAKSLASLELYYRNNPEGDFQSQAIQIIDDFKNKAAGKDQARLNQIDISITEINKQLQSNPNNEQLLKSLKALSDEKIIINDRAK